MLLYEFKNKIENLFSSKDIRFNLYRGDEGGQWYFVEFKAGLLKIYIASNCEMRINLNMMVCGFVVVIKPMMIF